MHRFPSYRIAKDAAWCTFVLTTLLLAPSGAFAQQSSSDSITVTATVQGVFVFSIAEASFDFGTVDADGTLSSTGIAGVRDDGLSGIGGATYTANSAATWTCRSAPQRTVRIYQDSAGSSFTGTQAEESLSIQIPTGTLNCPLCSGAESSTGFQQFSTAADANLMTGLVVRNGSSDVDGTLDLVLDVLDTAAPGANTWIVQITAEGL